MEYKELSELYHRDSSASRDSTNKKLAVARLSSESSFDIGIDTRAGRLFVAMPREMSVLYETALRAERKVSSMMRSIPPIAQSALVRGLVLDEVVSTNSLEDIRSTRRQVLDALNSATGGDPSARRFRELGNLYLGLSSSEIEVPKTPEDIRTIYDRVMDGELDEGSSPDGRLFRASGVDITAGGVRVVHRGVEPEGAIIEYIGRMLSLVRRSDIPTTVSALASHYVFEYIHPFYDGNGRTGRFLLSLFLSEALSTPTVLSLSRAITERKSAYYNAFKGAENPLNHGELTFFVYTMLELIRAAQSAVIDGLGESTRRFEAMTDAMPQFSASHGLRRHETEIVYVLAQYALFGMVGAVLWGELSACIGLGRQATRKHASMLEKKGLVEKASRRPLAFRLTEGARDTLGVRPNRS